MRQRFSTTNLFPPTNLHEFTSPRETGATDNAFSSGYISRVIIQPIEPHWSHTTLATGCGSIEARVEKKKKMDEDGRQIVSTDRDTDRRDRTSPFSAWTSIKDERLIISLNWPFNQESRPKAPLNICREIGNGSIPSPMKRRSGISDFVQGVTAHSLILIKPPISFSLATINARIS